MKTEHEVKAALLAKAASDAAFRAQLVADPRAALEQAFDITFTDEFSLHVHEETATSAHLVLPPARGGLGPSELEAVAGGNCGKWAWELI